MSWAVDFMTPSGSIVTVVSPDLTGGSIASAIHDLPDCLDCDGTGYAPRRAPHLTLTREHCPSCEGMGKVVGG